MSLMPVCTSWTAVECSSLTSSKASCCSSSSSSSPCSSSGCAPSASAVISLRGRPLRLHLPRCTLWFCCRTCTYCNLCLPTPGPEARQTATGAVLLACLAERTLLLGLVAEFYATSAASLTVCWQVGIHYLAAVRAVSIHHKCPQLVILRWCSLPLHATRLPPCSLWHRSSVQRPLWFQGPLAVPEFASLGFALLLFCGPCSCKCMYIKPSSRRSSPLGCRI